LIRQTLNRSEYIKSSGRISSIIREGNRIQGDKVTIHFNPSDKVAFAVLVKKKAGSAVERNKIKRWIREIYRQGKGQLDRTYEIIIVSNKPYRYLDHSVLEKDIYSLFKKL